MAWIGDLHGHLLSEGGPVIWGERVSEDLHPTPVVNTGNVVTKVRRDTTNPEPSIWSQILTESVLRLEEYLDLLQAQLGMSSCNSLPELLRQRV